MNDIVKEKNSEVLESTATQEVQVGMILKQRFVLEEKIGAGGMGTIFKAKDMRKSELDDKSPYVALKILSNEFKEHPKAVIALQRETRKAQRVSHPSIAAVYDFDRDNDIVFMTMELLEGPTLDEIIKDPLKHPLSQEAIIEIINNIASALCYAHKKGIVHSDIKPKNIIWTKDHEVKIIDFGISRSIKYKRVNIDDVELFSNAELAAHTPAYASYGMLKGKDPTESDDIYALACISYELLAHRHPYAKNSAKQAFEEQKVPKRIPGLERYRWAALKRALSFNDENKISTADEFIECFNKKKSSAKNIGLLILSILAIVGSLATIAWAFGIIKIHF